MRLGWLILVFLFSFSLSCQEAVEVEIAEKNPGKKTRFCPFCHREVEAMQKGAKAVGDRLGHFHRISWAMDEKKREKTLEKLMKIAKNLRLSEIYLKAIEKGALPLKVMLRLGDEEKVLIGAPLTRYEPRFKREVRYDFANVDKNSYFCPLCQVQVIPADHKHGKTAYDAYAKKERPYDFEQKRFLGVEKEKEEVKVAEKCPVCGEKTFYAAKHPHGKSFYCDRCLVEAWKDFHIHGITELCFHDDCFVGGMGTQVSFKSRFPSHVHGWTQFCPVCRTERPFEEITVVKSDGSRETVRGFVFDLVEVVKTEEALEALKKVKGKIQLYRAVNDSWPGSLEEAMEGEGLPSLEDGLAFEYEPKTGEARVIRVDPPPQVIVVRGSQVQRFNRGYLSPDGSEASTDEYVEKDPSNGFLLKRQVYQLALRITFHVEKTERRIKRSSTVEAEVGVVSSLEENSLSLQRPDETMVNWEAEKVVSGREIFDPQEAWRSIENGGTYRVIIVMGVPIKARNLLGEEVRRFAFHDHGQRIRKVYRVFKEEERVEEEELSEPLVLWEYVLRETKREMSQFQEK